MSLLESTTPPTEPRQSGCSRARGEYNLSHETSTRHGSAVGRWINGPNTAREIGSRHPAGAEGFECAAQGVERSTGRPDDGAGETGCEPPDGGTILRGFHQRAAGPRHHGRSRIADAESHFRF